MIIPLFILGGPPGAGKSTIGPILANELNFAFIEGDSVLPASYFVNASNGVQMDAAERRDWMDRVIDAAYNLALDSSTSGIVVACTSVTRNARNRLRQRVEEVEKPETKMILHYIWCGINENLSYKRVKNRTCHHWKAEMTAGCFEFLEVPMLESGDKREDVVLLDASKSVEKVIYEALAIMQRNVSDIRSKN